MIINIGDKINGYTVTTLFGDVDSTHSTPHSGLDLAMETGTPLTSIGEAVVVTVGEGKKLGNYIKLKLESGEEVIYGHLSNFKVKTGEIVNKGEVIGFSGNTGNSTGPHLHLQVFKDGNLVNPVPYAEQLQSVKEPPGFTESVQGVWQFIGDWKDNGFIYAISGKDVERLWYDIWHGSLEFIVNFSDMLIIVILILLLFAMFGSSKAARWIYWSFATYIIIKFIGGVI